MIWIFIGGILASAYGAKFTHDPVSWRRTIVKTAATGGLLIAALSFDAPWLITIGLMFGMLGDAFLSRDRDRGFLPGLGAFFIGHTLYLIWASAQFDIIGGASSSSWTLVGALCLFAFCLWMLRRWWPSLEALKGPVTLYVALSLALGTFAIAAASYPHGASFAIGVAGFLFSDIILAEQLFKMTPDDPKFRFSSSALWMFYWLGQLGILIGALVLSS